MSFKPITPPSADDHIESLMWANKWVKTSSDYKEPRVVMHCHLYESGLMIITQDYKAFVHEGSETFNVLKEALKTWHESEEETFSLVVKLTKKGKAELGINDEEITHKWLFSEGRYTQLRKQQTDGGLVAGKANPLLAGGRVQNKQRNPEKYSKAD